MPYERLRMSLFAPICTDPASGAAGAMAVYSTAVARIPAYQEFLREQGFDPETVRALEDFARIPVMTKKNYIGAYALNLRMINGDINGAQIISSSSGSSGEPTFYARGPLSIAESVELHRRILAGFNLGGGNTLIVVALAMGNWIGGTYTTEAAEKLSELGHRVVVVAPGVDKQSVLETVKTLGPMFHNVVLVGYPPFLVDVVDEADDEILAQNIKLILAGEAIGEDRRDSLLSALGKPGCVEDICVVYGTADAGMIGHETPSSIAIKRLALSHPALDEALFGGDAETSTFVEYDPNIRFIETEEDGHLLFTVESSNLLRYRINDVGAVWDGDEVRRIMAENGYQLEVATSTAGAGFVVLKRRSDVAVSFYAINIYPEPIRASLADPLLRGVLTGRFKIGRVPGAGMGSDTLGLDVEMRERIDPSTGLDEDFAQTVKEIVSDGLIRSNSEYRELLRQEGERVEPRITLHSFGSLPSRIGIRQPTIKDNEVQK